MCSVNTTWFVIARKLDAVAHERDSLLQVIVDSGRTTNPSQGRSDWHRGEGGESFAARDLVSSIGGDDKNDDVRRAHRLRFHLLMAKQTSSLRELKNAKAELSNVQRALQDEERARLSKYLTFIGQHLTRTKSTSVVLEQKNKVLQSRLDALASHNATFGAFESSQFGDDNSEVSSSANANALREELRSSVKRMQQKVRLFLFLSLARVSRSASERRECPSQGAAL